MAETQDDIQKLSPDKLLQGFNKTPLLVFILAALGVHLLAFGVDYVAIQMKDTPTADANAVDANASTDANAVVDANATPDANTPAKTATQTGDDEVDPRTPDYLTETQPAPKEPGLTLDETN
ncbi:MAG: hypothetical protein ACLFVY_02800 [Phycisphaerae bacterium]